MSIFDPNSSANPLPWLQEKSLRSLAEAAPGEAKGERSPEDTRTEDFDELRVLNLRCSIYESLSRRLLYDDTPVAARKMLLWAMSHLYLSEGIDTVVLSRRFLPTDIGVTPQEAVDAYRWLIEHGFIERIDDAVGHAEALVLRLLAAGVNESKQPLPPEEGVSFGFPGARIRGKPTLANDLFVPLSKSHLKALASWQFGDEDRRVLASALQEHLGSDRAYVEEVSVKADVPAALIVRLRYPLDQDDETIAGALQTAVLAWVRTRIAPSDA